MADPRNFSPISAKKNQVNPEPAVPRLTFDAEAEFGGHRAVLADEAAEEAARHGEACRLLPGPRGRRHRRPLK